MFVCILVFFLFFCTTNTFNFVPTERKKWKQITKRYSTNQSPTNFLTILHKSQQFFFSTSQRISMQTLFNDIDCENIHNFKHPTSLIKRVSSHLMSITFPFAKIVSKALAKRLLITKENISLNLIHLAGGRFAGKLNLLNANCLDCRQPYKISSCLCFYKLGYVNSL